MEMADKTSRYKGVLWPIAGLILSIIVMPLAIDQYPEFFHDNRWLLPLSVLCTLVLFIFPLLFHQRVNRFIDYVSYIPHVGLVLAGLLPLIMLAVLGVGGISLFRFHSRHLAAALRGQKASIVKAVPSDRTNQSPTVPETLWPSPKQEALIARLEHRWRDSIVTVRSSIIDDKNQRLSFVDDTGFFINSEGLVLTTAENLRLPRDNSRRKFEVLTSDGVAHKAREVDSAASPYWRTLSIKAKSKAIPLSTGKAIPAGKMLFIVGKSAHSGAIESRLAKMQEDADPFRLLVETPAGFNGSPIFDEEGKAVAVQVFRSGVGEYLPVECLRVPSLRFLLGAAQAKGEAEQPKRPQGAVRVEGKEQERQRTQAGDAQIRRSNNLQSDGKIPLTQNCQGGICAGGAIIGNPKITNNYAEPPPPQVQLVCIYKNRARAYVSGSGLSTPMQGFESQYRVRVTGQEIPQIDVQVRNPSFIHVDCDRIVNRSGDGTGGSGTNFAECSLENIHGEIGSVTIFTITQLPAEERFLGYRCRDAACNAIKPLPCE